MPQEKQKLVEKMEKIIKENNELLRWQKIEILGGIRNELKKVGGK